MSEESAKVSKEGTTEFTFQKGDLNEVTLSFCLHSRSSAIGPCVKMLIGILKGFSDGSPLTLFEIALDEAIRNAYEHGNLEISDKEKTRLLEADTFEEELKRRELNAKEKLIRIDVSLNDSQFNCVITDEGGGFDWRKAPDSTEELTSLDDLHGRGLLLIRKLFDSVTYNEKGNQVTLSKKLPIRP